MGHELALEQRQRIEEQLRLTQLARALRPGAEPPYLAHARVRTTAGAERDLLFGTTTAMAPGLALLDWRTAPLAEAFFAGAEGEPYAVDLEDRTLEGVLLRRSMVAFERRELVEIRTDAATLTRRDREDWVALPPARGPALLARPNGRVSRPATILELELDPVQRRVVELPPGRAVLVLGQAGCGKTTVALHRLARLAGSVPGPFRAAVVVPTEGLRTLSAAMVDELGLTGVEVWRYDRFAAWQARRAFPDLPRRESVGASAGVVRLKRHSALRAALAEVARLPAAPAEEGRRRRRSRALARLDDLHALFGDRLLVERAVAAAAGELPRYCVGEVLEHTRLQFSTPSEEEFADVLPEARHTSDGRPIDDGTPMEDAGTVDAEDYAVMFELDRLRSLARGGRAVAPSRYHCLVLDEAQEMAPLELAMLRRSLRPGGSLVVAGDADQQLDPTTPFRGWSATMAELGATIHERALLEVNYRCPPAVIRFARTLRSDEASPASAPPGRALALQSYGRFDSELHLAAWLVEALRALHDADPCSSVAVVCRSAEAATRLGRALTFGVGARLALQGHFTFSPGVQVTCVDEVKGLEFDHVIVPDAHVSTYPDTAAARRALYVAVTRARHQVVLAGSGPAAGLLRPLLDPEHSAD